MDSREAMNIGRYQFILWPTFQMGIIYFTPLAFCARF